MSDFYVTYVLRVKVYLGAKQANFQLLFGEAFLMCLESLFHSTFIVKYFNE